MKSRIKNKMRGGSPAYDHHVAEGLLNQESTHLSNMPLTQLESAPVENYANLYQISGGARRKRKVCGGPRRNKSNKSKRCGPRKRTIILRRRRPRRNRSSQKRQKSKRCGCGKKK